MESLFGARTDPVRLLVFQCPTLHRLIVGMRFQMILRTRLTIEMQNLLSILSLWHGISFSGKGSIALALVDSAEGSSR